MHARFSVAVSILCVILIRLYVWYRNVCRRKLGASVQDVLLCDRDGGPWDGTWKSSWPIKELHSQVSCPDGLISHFRSVPLLFILELILDVKFMFLSSLRFVFQLTFYSIVLPCRLALPCHGEPPSMRAVEKTEWYFIDEDSLLGWGFFSLIPRDSVYTIIHMKTWNKDKVTCFSLRTFLSRVIILLADREPGVGDPFTVLFEYKFWLFKSSETPKRRKLEAFHPSNMSRNTK